MSIQIAIDGYSSCGKSTLAKALAKKLNILYLDTGAMYRAVTFYFLENNIPLDNPDAIKQALSHIEITFPGDRVVLNGNDISDAIRQMRISEKVSQVSSIREVRQTLVRLQQEMGKSRDVIMDGRDIGTTVFPDAILKIFMTADPLIRAHRRFDELILKGEKVTFEEVFENLHKRDMEDTSRSESPLIQAKEAIILDNSHLNQEQQLDFVVTKLQKLLPGI